jgi:hypothetical protein
MPDRESVFDEVAPDPSSMIESMRSTGYTLPTAISDLIDNSIAASAKNVWVHFEWEDSEPWVRIADDGDGMAEGVLRDAMRLGSRHPLEDRDDQDLGRFGLGLKTASLSQCRCLTVASTPPQGKQNIRRWDLDYLAQPDVKGWQLLKSALPGSENRIKLENKTSHGTVVLWENVDRVRGPESTDQEAARSHFLRQIEQVESHIAMVFHRYIGGTRPSLQIFVNGNRVKAWDPFLESHPSTQSHPIDPIRLPAGAGVVHVKGFVLPHKDRLGDADHAEASGPAGWNAQQGFYVYRNQRLILPGSWLGLGKGRPWIKEEHYKLARIRIDISNTMDQLWQLDVKKSTASPPAAIRDRLYNLANAVRKTARDVYAHRGRYGQRKDRQEYSKPWRDVRIGGTACYRINRKHPLVHSVIKNSTGDLREYVDAMLKILEETVPVNQIWLDAAEHPDAPAAPFENADDIQLQRVIEIAYAALRSTKRLSHDEAIANLLAMEEFAGDRAAAIIATLKQED